LLAKAEGSTGGCFNGELSLMARFTVKLWLNGDYTVYEGSVEQPKFVGVWSMAILDIADAEFQVVLPGSTPIHINRISLRRLLETVLQDQELRDAVKDLLRVSNEAMDLKILPRPIHNKLEQLQLLMLKRGRLK
jgi:hypothetical protein